MNYGTLQHFQGWILFDMQRSGVQTARYSQQSFSHDLTKSYLWYLWYPLISLRFDRFWSLWKKGDFWDRGIPDPWGSLGIPGAQCCNLQLSRQLAPASLHFISRCLGFLCSMAGCGWLTDTVVSSNNKPWLIPGWFGVHNFKKPANWWYCATNYWIHKKHVSLVPLTSLNIKHSNLGAPCLQTITIRNTTQTIDKPPDRAHLRP